MPKGKGDEDCAGFRNSATRFRLVHCGKSTRCQGSSTSDDVEERGCGWVDGVIGRSEALGKWPGRW